MSLIEKIKSSLKTLRFMLDVTAETEGARRSLPADAGEPTDAVCIDGFIGLFEFRTKDGRPAYAAFRSIGNWMGSLLLTEGYNASYEEALQAVCLDVLGNRLNDMQPKCPKCRAPKGEPHRFKCPALGGQLRLVATQIGGKLRVKPR